jgi:glycosyltransferase involved in cell wall biosynthesis
MNDQAIAEDRGSRAPFFLVITRTRDRPMFLARALRSVMEQTERDFVHVVVNDGGDPDHVEQAARAAGVPTNAFVLISTPHQGMEAASNTAIASYDSRFVAVHDDDDTWAPEFLAVARASVEEGGHVAAVLPADYVAEVVEDDTIVEIERHAWLPEMRTVSLYRQLRHNQLTPIATVIQRDALRDVGGFDPSMPVSGDWELGLRLLARHHVEFVPYERPLAHYHHRSRGVLQNSVYADRDLHARQMQLVRNELLRKDLESGVTGLGTLMNLSYDIERRHRAADDTAAEAMARIGELIAQAPRPEAIRAIVREELSLRHRLARYGRALRRRVARAPRP